MTTHNVHKPNCCEICAKNGEDDGYRCSDLGHWLRTGRVKPNEYRSLALIAAGRSEEIEGDSAAEINPRVRFGKDEVRLFLSKFILEPLASMQMRISNYTNSVLTNICSDAKIKPFKNISVCKNNPCNINNPSRRGAELLTQS